MGEGPVLGPGGRIDDAMLPNGRIGPHGKWGLQLLLHLVLQFWKQQVPTRCSEPPLFLSSCGLWDHRQLDSVIEPRRLGN
jgi:hypothetical protein